MIFERISEVMGWLGLDLETIIGLAFTTGVVLYIVSHWVLLIAGIQKVSKKRSQRGGMHLATINRPSQSKRSVQPPGKPGPTIASDGHKIPHSKDITCEGQYGHNHGDMPPRFIVHEEPTIGYCNLNGKIVALKDCWKY